MAFGISKLSENFAGQDCVRWPPKHGNRPHSKSKRGSPARLKSKVMGSLQAKSPVEKVVCRCTEGSSLPLSCKFQLKRTILWRPIHRLLALRTERTESCQAAAPCQHWSTMPQDLALGLLQGLLRLEQKYGGAAESGKRGAFRSLCRRAERLPSSNQSANASGDFATECRSLCLSRVWQSRATLLD